MSKSMTRRNVVMAAAVSSLVAVRPGALAAAVDPQADKEPPKDETRVKDFSGKYLAEGVGNGGRPYKAMVEIQRTREVYQILWVLGPREAYMGVGMREGDTLCVGWATGQVPGVVVYRSEGKRLVGRWTAPGADGRIFKETLSPVE